MLIVRDILLHHRASLSVQGKKRRKILRGLEVLKYKSPCSIVKKAIIVVKLYLSKAPYQYLLKKRLIAFVR